MNRLFPIRQLRANTRAPTPSEVAEQYKFATRLQEGESISSFQAELRRLSITCNFLCGARKKSTVSAHLRTQCIRGVRDSDIRENLLQQESKTTFDKIVKLAISIEAAKSKGRELRQQPSSASVH